MRILYANAPLHHTHIHVFMQPDWQTLILPILASITGREHEIKLIDNMRLWFKSNIILEEIQKFQPDIVGFSIIASIDIYRTLNVIKQVRQKYPDIVLLAGAQAGSYYNEILLKNGVDFVVHGEGEITLKELINNIKEKNKDFSKIKGISYLVDRAVYRTEPRPQIGDLDVSPLPAIDLMPRLKSKWFPGRYTGAIEISRGCPFQCDFCAITHYYKGSFRQKSNERIMEEFRILKHYGRTHVYIIDDTFGINVKKHMKLFERMISEDLDIKWYVQIRTDTIVENPEMIELAAKAGMYGGLIGFDTYESDVFTQITKIGSSELNIKASEIMRKNKIAVLGSHIYGFPTQKRPLDFTRTFRMGRKYSDVFRMPLFSPHPGTKLYNELKEQKLIDESREQDFSKLLIGDKDYQRKMTFGFYIYQLINHLLPAELFGALFHPNRAIRKLKFYGYVSSFRFLFYKILRKLKLCDI